MESHDDGFIANFAGEEPSPETGRGRRQSRPTAGMIEHAETLRRNHEAARRRRETLAMKQNMTGSSTATGPVAADGSNKVSNLNNIIVAWLLITTKVPAHGTGEKRMEGERNEREDANPNKKKRKKNRITRSDQLVNNQRRILTERAYPFLRVRIACMNAFPDDETEQLFICNAFWDAVEKLGDMGLDLSKEDLDPSPDEGKLIHDRIAQTRGDVRDIFVEHLDRWHKFVPCSSSNEAAKNTNRELYKRLITNNAYVYEDPENLQRGMYRHASISFAIKKMWFDSKNDLGITMRGYFDKDGALPHEIIALAATAKRYALDQWETGVAISGKDGIKFTENKYASCYRAHLRNLTQWEAYSNIRNKSCLLLRRQLLSDALEHAGVTVEVTDENIEGFSMAHFAREDE
ncbi:hypothetical protein EW026_g8164 [Hermanssonia centrifuga]|uniref:DUF6532 domain-containing protein n=1 Tax=Hermanssonia centrifuga TaxID=98765 RepID=A0A4V3X961_9APHY|nr:hypothetical protein EW026_g8164 [Hermanssonia centrifuga]